MSYRISSPRCTSPMTNSFFPSLLGIGVDNDIGLEVSCIGEGERSKKVVLGNAQTWLADWNTKYSPSAVHRPQHSSGGLCQPASSRRRSLPFIETSQNSCWPTVCELSNRNRGPSGDHTIELISPATDESLREPVPLASAISNSLCLA